MPCGICSSLVEKLLEALLMQQQKFSWLLAVVDILCERERRLIQFGIAALVWGLVRKQKDLGNLPHQKKQQLFSVTDKHCLQKSQFRHQKVVGTIQEGPIMGTEVKGKNNSGHDAHLTFQFLTYQSGLQYCLMDILHMDIALHIVLQLQVWGQIVMFTFFHLFVKEN